MKTFIFIAIIFCVNQNLAQVNGSNEELMDSLKPISFYLNKAVENSPLLKMYQANVDIKEIESDLLKFAWMREIYATADSKLGSYGNANPIDQFNLGYGLGAFVRLPLTTIIGNKQRKQIAKLQIDANQMQHETMKLELMKTVITQYEQVKLKKNILKIQTNAVDVAMVNYKYAEKEFNAGSITIDAYARTSEIYFTQLTSLEQTISDFITSYKILNEMCGI